MITTDSQWIGSRRCESSGCGQIRRLSGGRIAIRSSRHQFNIAILDADEWAEFKAAIIAGDFGEES